MGSFHWYVNVSIAFSHNTFSDGNERAESGFTDSVSQRLTQLTNFNGIGFYDVMIAPNNKLGQRTVDFAFEVTSKDCPKLGGDSRTCKESQATTLPQNW